ncbi:MULTISPECIES: hypothetical protein [unclassified Rhizobium]|nr:MULTISPECIES: hypothetical protein [unclassified Rhizobium]MBP2462086.1 hypothetical protein [Rhizobium sp. PvP014]MBP2529482.1 hypothetical protein [Rhizobium sp. PvP099]
MALVVIHMRDSEDHFAAGDRVRLLVLRAAVWVHGSAFTAVPGSLEK